MEISELLIDGKSSPAADGKTFDRVNPVTGEVVTRASAASVEDANCAVSAAAAAMPVWSNISPSERRSKLQAAAELMLERRDAFVDMMVAETGAILPWAHHNVDAAAAIIVEAAALITAIGGEVIPSNMPGTFSMAIRQPVGVILGIAPWNAPIILGTRAIAMALACGNTVVLKGSEMCPGLHRMIGQVFQDAGLGDGVVNVVTNAPADAAEVVGALIKHRAVRRINFTGSTSIGRQIAEQAGRLLKPVLLELGGKAPLLVLDDADIDEAVKAAAFGAFFNMGQICMSTERIIVDRAIADEFISKFAEKTRSLNIVPSGKGNPPLGVLINEAPGSRVAALIDDALSSGAQMVVGGKANGVFMPATVLDHVTPAMKIYHEESFGPVVSIIRVNGDEEAIACANDTEYGLSASVFSKNIVRALAVAKRIESGACHINGATVADEPQVPFGGAKASGYGRFGGRAGINEFTELRWITIETGPGHFPI